MMKRLLVFFFLIPCLSQAGTITTSFNPLGTITFSTGTVPPGVIAFDTFVSTLPLAGLSPLNFNITIGSSANRFLVLGCGTASSDLITGVTVGGNAMTLTTSTVNSPTANYIYTYIAPPSGSQVIAVTDSQNVAARMNCAAASFSGVSQVTPVDFSTGTINYPYGNNAYSTSTLTTSAAGDGLFDIVNNNNGDLPTVTQPNQFALFVSSNSSSMAVSVSTRTTTTPGVYDMGWRVPGGLIHFTNSIAIKPTP